MISILRTYGFLLTFAITFSCAQSSESPTDSIELIQGVDDGVLFFESPSCRLYMDSTENLSIVQKLITSGLIDCTILKSPDCPPPLGSDTTYCAFLIVSGFEGKAARILGVDYSLDDNGEMFDFDLYYASGSSSLYHCYFSMPATFSGATSDFIPDYAVEELQDVNIIREL